MSATFRAVPLRRRLMHLGLHAGIVVLGWLALIPLALAAIVGAALPAGPVWGVAFAFGLWQTAVTSAINLIASRFPAGPWMIAAVHLITPPFSLAVFLALNGRIIAAWFG